MTIAAIINYCSNDYRFLARALAEVSSFASQIIVPVCDHFFDGTPENRPLLERTYSEHSNVLFLEFAYDGKELYTPYVRRSPEDEDWGALWHSTARYLSFLYLDDSIEYLLFLDADEILAGGRFTNWLRTEEFRKWDALWFLAYCYGFLPSKLAPDIQQTALLVKRSALSPLKILSAQERFGLFAGLSGPKRLQITDFDGKPMIHHYSWVRPRDECLKKSRTWGKKHLRNWDEWLEKSHEMDSYPEVPVYFDPLSVSLPSIRVDRANSHPHVIRVDRYIAFRRELAFSGFDAEGEPSAGKRRDSEDGGGAE